jgi:hypothetical protein
MQEFQWGKDQTRLCANQRQPLAWERTMNSQVGAYVCDGGLSISRLVVGKASSSAVRVDGLLRIDVMGGRCVSIHDVLRALRRTAKSSYRFVRRFAVSKTRASL